MPKMDLLAILTLLLPCLMVGSLSKSITSGLPTCTSPTIMTSSREWLVVGPGDSIVIGSLSVPFLTELCCSMLLSFFALLYSWESGVVEGFTVAADSLVVLPWGLSSLTSSTLLLLFTSTRQSVSSLWKRKNNGIIKERNQERRLFWTSLKNTFLQRGDLCKWVLGFLSSMLSATPT